MRKWIFWVFLGGGSMKISDVVMGRTVLESLAEKKILLKNSNLINNSDNQTKAKDIFDSDRVKNSDISKIKELQSNYMKNTSSLTGLNALNDKVEEFEKSPDKTNQKNYDQLSSELNDIVASTKYGGESVISYLSTNIRDEKSLYTFKANLNNEISGIKGKLSEERKNIAAYLVMNENLEGARAFSSEKTLNNVLAVLDKNNLEKVYNNISNISTLLGIEK